MIELTAKLKVPRAAYRIEVHGRLELPFETRRRSVPGEVLRGGDLATASDGRVFEVVAVREKLLQIEAPDLARLAWHLGSNHVPVQFGQGFLRIPWAPGADEFARQLGARVTEIEEPFEPEVVEHEHNHGHEHEHDHDHGHHHGHGHE